MAPSLPNTSTSNRTEERVYPTQPPQYATWNPEVGTFSARNKYYFWKAHTSNDSRGRIQPPGWYWTDDSTQAREALERVVPDLRNRLPATAFGEETPNEPEPARTEVTPNEPRPAEVEEEESEEEEPRQETPTQQEETPRTPVQQSTTALPTPGATHLQSPFHPVAQYFNTATTPIPGSGNAQPVTVPAPGTRAPQPTVVTTASRTPVTAASQPRTMTAEIRIGRPKEFRGDTDKSYARRFIASCQDYIDLNSTIYDTDKKKIIFTTSFMLEGPAGQWAINLSDAAAAPGGTYGTWTDFKSNFKSKFITQDDKAGAIQELSTMKQGTKTADEFNNEFQSAVARAGVTEFAVLKGYYENAINRPLLLKIYSKGEAPDSIDAYYKAASNHDNLYRRLQAIASSEGNRERKPNQGFNRFKQRTTTTSVTTTATPTPGQQIPGPPKLTPEERARCIAQGLCLACRKPGHFANNCPNRNNFRGPRPQYPQNIRVADAAQYPDNQGYYTNYAPQPYGQQIPMIPAPAPPAPPPSKPLPSRPSPAEQAALIRKIVGGYDEKQKEEFFHELDEEGF